MMKWVLTRTICLPYHQWRRLSWSAKYAAKWYNYRFYFHLFVRCDYFRWCLTPDLLRKTFLVGPPNTLNTLRHILWFNENVSLIGLLFRGVCFYSQPKCHNSFISITIIIPGLSFSDMNKTIVLNKFPWPAILMPQWAQVNTINWRMMSK